ncbi:hypothetical protein [Paludibacter sp.]|uniref:hypothetical protein n=1 Tax=Paludibacter sp. TaxID=1898105 RepID=UPI0013555087|nr:hypothetical protein [Paludibacter sp.]MTK54094.1 hypothetical protein [Paludibacter sp.]
MNIFGKPEFWYTVTSISVAFIIYFLSQNKKSGKRLILKLYLANQTLSLSIQKDLEGFIEKHNAFNAIAFPEKNITYGHMLEQMKAEFEVNLSESLYQKLKKKNLSKPEIEVAIDSLNKQNEALRLVDLDMKLVIRKADSSLN